MLQDDFRTWGRSKGASIPWRALAQKPTSLNSGRMQRYFGRSINMPPARLLLPRSRGPRPARFPRRRTRPVCLVYLYPSLQPGVYRLAAERPGFKKYVLNEVSLNTADKVSINL